MRHQTGWIYTSPPIFIISKAWPRRNRSRYSTSSSCTVLKIGTAWVLIGRAWAIWLFGIILVPCTGRLTGHSCTNTAAIWGVLPCTIVRARPGAWTSIPTVAKAYLEMRADSIWIKQTQHWNHSSQWVSLVYPWLIDLLLHFTPHPKAGGGDTSPIAFPSTRDQVHFLCSG